jgi:hypothetical protein
MYEFEFHYNSSDKSIIIAFFLSTAMGPMVLKTKTNKKIIFYLFFINGFISEERLFYLYLDIFFKLVMDIFVKFAVIIY